MQIQTIVIFLFLVATANGVLAGAKAPATAEKKAGGSAEKKPEIFDLPPFLLPDVEFWAKVYREWDTHQVVFYDSLTKTVYSVVNLPRLEFALSASKYRKEVDAETNRLQDAFVKISMGEQPDDNSTQDFANIYHLLKSNELLHEKDLKERLRQQSGLRSQFEYGLRMSGRYIDDMTAVLRSQQMPEELLAMVFVESLFSSVRTVSHAGATGLWGIMKETATLSGIHVNKFTDERIDPVVATLGAARYLKKAKENLSEWPLVITAYNYGYPGMMRAVSTLGSKDFAVIVAKHDSPIFKYASKSYYAEFLGALDTLRNQHLYFPDLKKEKPWEYEVVQVQRSTAGERHVISRCHHT